MEKGESRRESRGESRGVEGRVEGRVEGESRGREGCGSQPRRDSGVWARARRPLVGEIPDDGVCFRLIEVGKRGNYALSRQRRQGSLEL